jgi:hypothetical protein
VSSAPAVFVLPELDDDDYRRIAARIFRNEARGEVRYLTHWGAGEDFPSLGIGHFIWFPAGVDAPFDETFPALTGWLRTHGARCPMPAWLAELEPFDAPWPDKAAFDAAQDTQEMRELRQWLAGTAPQQARFIAAHFVQRWNELALPADEKKTLTELLQAMVEVPEGLFAVVDYVNFKGLGSNPRERYDGHGWGLLQVLGDVASGRQPRDAPSDLVRRFSEAAASRLEHRARLAPPGRDEQRWVPGWTRRVSEYPQPAAEWRDDARFADLCGEESLQP